MKAIMCGLAASLVLTAAIASCEAAKLTIEKTTYAGESDCCLLSNGKVDVIVTTKTGPRVLAYRLKGGENTFNELGPDAKVDTEFGSWRARGGHRLWHVPEAKPRTYVPDEEPVTVKEENNGVRFTQNVEKQTGMQKEMFISLDLNSTEVRIMHKITNKGVWPVDTAPWALTIVKPGGVEIIPNEPWISHDDKLLAARKMVLWHYTELGDSRFTWGKKYTRVTPDSKKDWPNKIGLENKQGWAGYFVNGGLFIKKYPYLEGKTYPDDGCNYETYTSGDFLEMETLSNVVTLQPGESAEHVENWYLFPNVKVADTDEGLDKVLEPLLKQITK